MNLTSLGLDAVTLAELDQAQLHDRVESKVVMRFDGVGDTLARLSDDYLIMEHQGSRVQRYSNVYFDTSDLTNYFEHHNQKRRHQRPALYTPKMRRFSPSGSISRRQICRSRCSLHTTEFSW